MGREVDERLLWVGLAVVAVVLVLVVWATGVLAGAIFGSGPATVPPGGAVAVLIRLPSHLADPATAWQPPARGRLPGAVPIYACAAVLLLGVCALGALAITAAGRLDLPSIHQRREGPPAASWARTRDLGTLIVPSPQERRLTLGRRGRRLLAAEAGQSVVVFGPTSTHKTSGLVIPAILEWEGPLVATSVKSDILGPTIERREALGEVWVFDPAQQSPFPRARWSPLSEVEGWPDALRVAHWLAGAARSASRDLSDSDFWFRNAEKLIAPLLLAAVRAGEPMGTVAAWIDEGPEATEEIVKPILADAGEAEARRHFLATQNREERQRSSVYTTAETIVAAFDDPRVAEETAGSDFTPELLLAGANTVFLIGPQSEQERLATVFSTLIRSFWACVERIYAATEEAIDPALGLILDECANLAPLPELDGHASTARGLGIQMMTAFHDLAQVKARFGPRAETIVNNHYAKLAGRGISDPSTLRYFSELIGAGRFDQRSVSTQRGEQSRRSETEGDTYRELAPGHVLRENAEASAVLVYGSLPPAVVELRPWFDEPELIAKHEAGPVPPGEEPVTGGRG